MTHRLLLGTLLFIGVQSGPDAHTTLAFFATSVGSTANQFSAGTVHIADSLGAGTTLSMDNLVAGDNFDAELTISNSGSLALTYAMSTITSGDATLANALQLTLRARTAQPCSDRDGAVLYSGALAGAALGDPAHGVQAGDRSLAPGASEVLCFTLAAPNSVTSQATSVAATFAFDAVQS
ncbi:MAG TPA: hypothetical protein VGL99_00725 [Chloroflexota bacterium]